MPVNGARRTTSLVRWRQLCWLTCAAIWASGCTGAFEHVRAGEVAPPSSIEALVVYPVSSKLEGEPLLSFQKTWDLLERIRSDGNYVAIGPDEFSRRRGAVDEPFRQSTLILTANRLAVSPDNMLILVGSATERVQRTTTVIQPEAGGRAASAAGKVSTVILRIEAIHPGLRAPVLRAEIVVNEDPFAVIPDHDPRPAVTAAWRQLSGEVLAALGTLAPGVDQPTPWGFGVKANPVKIIKIDPEYEKLDMLEKEVAADQRLRYFYPELQARTKATFMRSPPGALVVTSLGGEGLPAPPQSLVVGDVVISANGEKLMGEWHLDRILRLSDPKEVMTLQVRRGAEEVDVAWRRDG